MTIFFSSVFSFRLILFLNCSLQTLKCMCTKLWVCLLLCILQQVMRCCCVRDRRKWKRKDVWFLEKLASWIQMPAWGAGHHCLCSVTSARAQWCKFVWLCAVLTLRQQPPVRPAVRVNDSRSAPPGAASFVCLNLQFTPRKEAKQEKWKMNKVWIFLLRVLPYA